MRKIKIVADSSANLLKLQSIDFSSAPLKIITESKEFTDDADLDVKKMLEFLDTYDGKSKTSCPNTTDWLAAFGDADDIFCVTITSGLSGSYNSACAAKEIFENEHPEKRVFIIDSLSAGPELELIIEKLEELIKKGLDYQEICRQITAYTKKTGLLFILESLKNFAANGRVSPAVAKIVGLLGIRIVGKASGKGELDPMNKCRGEKNALKTIMGHLKDFGLSSGKVRISHCENSLVANQLKKLILRACPKADVKIRECKGLCSYYAQNGGVLVGFEKM